MKPRTDDVLAYREARDPRACSRRALRHEFLMQPPHVQALTRQRVQERVNEEREAGRMRPSPLAVALAEGVYDPPKPGELERLEAEFGW